MHALGFISLTMLLFAALFAGEFWTDRQRQSTLQSGLFSWLIGGNWPAKVGAGLLIFGVGALIRYAFLHVNVSDQAKLLSGALAAGLLGISAFVLRNKRERRALHLALAGSAFGVAYLTAYSAFGLFNYLDDLNGMSLLVVVAAAAALFAMGSNAISIAVLSMVGAFIAPAFAINPAPPPVLFGYYIAASLLSFLVVWQRGWRALIHLSFLFTLAGGLFLGWTHSYYAPQYHAVMQPILLLLVAIHLLMPVVEQARHGLRAALPYRLDIVYSLVLPVTAAILTLYIAPGGIKSAVSGLLALSALWAVVGGGVQLFRQQGAARHYGIALLLLLAAGLIAIDDAPWFLVLLATVTVFLLLAPRLEVSTSIQNLSLTLILILAFLHMLESLFRAHEARVLWWQLLVEKSAGVMLLATCAWISRERQLILSKLLGGLALVWGVLVVSTELARLHIEHWQLMLHAALIVFTLLFALSGKARRADGVYSLGLACAILLSATLSQHEQNWSPLLIVLAPLSLLVLSWKNNDRHRGANWSVLLPLLLVPCVAGLWASSLRELQHVPSDFFAPVLVLLSVLVTLVSAASYIEEITDRHASLARMVFFVIMVPSAYLLLLHIEIDPWAAIYDGLALLILLFIAFMRQGRTGDIALLMLAFLAASLTIQAMLLRVFGTGGVMTIGDLQRMQLPALVSLLWASLGASLTIVGKKVASRPLWIAGATLLILSAVKIVLFDFGSFGQLGNILAVILSGLVFLAVSWFAPFPPAQLLAHETTEP